MLHIVHISYIASDILQLSFRYPSDILLKILKRSLRDPSEILQRSFRYPSDIFKVQISLRYPSDTS